MDSFVIGAIAKELAETLKGGRIYKIHQPYPSELILKIRLKGVSKNLIISAHPEWPRVHIIKDIPENPSSPHGFCMLLRKFIQGGFIISIDQDGLERIISISIGLKDKRYELILEIIGKQSNIILIDKNRTILGLIRPLHSDKKRLSIGEKYQSPPFKKIDPLLCSESEFQERLISQLPEGELWKDIVKHYRGISPLIAKEIECRAQKSKSGDSLEKKLWKASKKVFNLFKEEKFSPAVFINKEQDKIFLSSIPLLQFKTWKKIEYDSISEAAERYYQDSMLKLNLLKLKERLLKNIKRAIKKEKKIGEICVREIKKYKEWEVFKFYGALILARLSLIKKGMDRITLKNYYSQKQELIEVPLDASLNPQANAEKYFKKYKKAQRGIKILKERLNPIKERIKSLEQTMKTVKDAQDLKVLEKIYDELKKNKIVKEKERKREKRTKKAFPYRRYCSKDGWSIFVGKDAKGNDYITTVLGKEDDLWLHAHGTSGSHVIIKNKKRGEEVPHSILKKGAELAAYHSKARGSSKVPVAYTLVKHVKKIKGKRSGTVSLSSYKTILVSPKPSDMNKLKEIY